MYCSIRLDLPSILVANKPFYHPLERLRCAREYRLRWFTCLDSRYIEARSQPANADCYQQLDAEGFLPVYFEYSDLLPFSTTIR